MNVTGKFLLRRKECADFFLWVDYPSLLKKTFFIKFELCARHKVHKKIDGE